MAEESFEDAEIAALLNRDFVPVKVDREERPDVDAVYMRACQAMTGSGGWPLTAFLTPDQVPFFTGTYFPKHNFRGHVGLFELLTAVSAAWQGDRASLLDSGDAIGAYLADKKAPEAADAQALPRRAYTQLRSAYDPEWGGFGAAPKFPTPATILFLLRYYAMESVPDAFEIAENTLLHMFRGGMFDHLGGGFCRYSTDRRWLIPHFEKMLYDNALLLCAYAQAYRISPREEYRDAAGRIVEYLAKEMLSPEGGFYAAQDADSDGREGAYYALRPEESIRVLGEEVGRRFNRAFGIDEAGNFEGASVPNRIGRPEPLDDEMRAAARRMAEYRRHRRTLTTDDKIMTEWNALAIGALASAARSFGRGDMLALAGRARRFVWERLNLPEGLCAYFREGKAVGRAHLGDYAALAWANLELYAATLDPALVPETGTLLNRMVERFYDPDAGDFYLGEAGGDLSFRSKEHMDGASASGNSLAAHALMGMYRITGEAKWRDLGEGLTRAIAAHANDYPAGCCFGMEALLRGQKPALRVGCRTGDPARIEAFAALAGGMYLKNAALALEPAEPGEHPGTSYHLCEGEACAAPITDDEALERALTAYAVQTTAGSR